MITSAGRLTAKKNCLTPPEGHRTQNLDCNRRNGLVRDSVHRNRNMVELVEKNVFQHIIYYYTVPVLIPHIWTAYISTFFSTERRFKDRHRNLLYRVKLKFSFSSRIWARVLFQCSFVHGLWLVQSCVSYDVVNSFKRAAAAKAKLVCFYNNLNFRQT